MSSTSLTKFELYRLRWVWTGMFAGLLLLLFSLWRMQIGLGAQYEGSVDKQSIRRVRIPGVRGRVLDRNGLPLADNAPSYDVAIYLEELRRPGRRGRTIEAVRNLLDYVGGLIETPSKITDRQIEQHLIQRPALPLIAWSGLTQTELARLAEQGGELQALEIMVDARRVYPQGSAAGHLLGYVGKTEHVDSEEPFHYYLPDLSGRAGLERKFDEFLSAAAGGQLVRVDVAGFRHEEIGSRPPEPGGDLWLTLDFSVQAAAENALKGVRGAVVVLNPQNGEVLALASSPSIDPNWFVPSLSSQVWQDLLNDQGKPLINRALAGMYAPGSIWKPTIGLLALEEGVITPASKIDCSGFIMLGRQRFSCYHSHAHGTINLTRALEVSCNVFFYQIGLQCGIDSIEAMGRSLGLGQKSGIEAEAEASGLMPGKAWKRQVQGEGWREGDTCNVSIGQGALLVTPLQMAVMVAAIANGGLVYQPKLIFARQPNSEESLQIEPPAKYRVLNWQTANLEVIRSGMWSVVQGTSGTGRALMIPGVRLAAKTGTAEYGRKQDGRKHGWMIAYAPFEKPRYAAAMVLDDVTTAGGAEVAPRMRQLFCSLFQIAEEE